MDITRIIEWDMGHRVPNHNNKCKHPHGHRYRLEATISGQINKTQGSSSEGMVLDFGDLKSILVTHVHNILDHKFMIYEGDDWLKTMQDSQVTQNGFFVVPFIPTAENIVMWCSEKLNSHLPASLRLKHLRLYETPNTWTDYYPQEEL